MSKSGRLHWINGDLVRSARIDLGKSLREVERDTGLSYMLLNNIERKSIVGSQLTLAELNRLAMSLEVPAQELITRNPE